MRRDFDLLRKILFAIEEQYDPNKGLPLGLKIEGYELPIIAEHCDLLYQENLIKAYKPQYADNKIYFFSVGNLTYKGYDFLELIRNEKVWKETNGQIEEKKLPKTIEMFTKIAGVFMGNFLKEFTDL